VLISLDYNSAIKVLLPLLRAKGSTHPAEQLLASVQGEKMAVMLGLGQPKELKEL